MTQQQTELLIEIGTEELPPKALRGLELAFAGSISRQLSDARLSFSGIQSFATPRRLAVRVHELSLKQTDQQVERRGPPTKIAFDASGNPTKAAVKFATSNGIALDKLETLDTDKGSYLVHRGIEAGRKTEELVPGFVENALNELPIPRRMRWGNNDTEFVRPVHWVVLMAGASIIDANILGHQTGNITFGHRFHAPDAIRLERAEEYPEKLEDGGKVVTGFLDRKAQILSMAQDAAKAHNATVYVPDELLDEVTALVEWPIPVVGSFDEAFLQLPDEVLISTLQEHQRYFPMYKIEGGLTNQFITISNIASIQPDQVRLGNEKVVKPRLADAAFFWEQDLKLSLGDRAHKLSDVVYQKGLGSIHDKSQRVAELAGVIAGALGDTNTNAIRAGQLAKADLLTEMVGEFPELQGVMGRYYAKLDGEPDDVAIAIGEHYLPRFAGDDLPTTSTGQAVSIADRLDTLTGIFALGRRPSGNKDPFALRRLALGLVRILIESQIDLDLKQCIQQARELQPVKSDAIIVDDIYEFIVDRLKSYYLDGQNPLFKQGDISAEQFETVRQRVPVSPLDFHQRLKAVVEFALLPEGESLAAANKRIANILKAAKLSGTEKIDPDLLSEPAELLLFEALTSIADKHADAVSRQDYGKALSQLAGLRAPVDSFFDSVMVNADDAAIKANRLALLSRLRGLFLDVADLSALSPR